MNRAQWWMKATPVLAVCILASTIVIAAAAKEKKEASPGRMLTGKVLDREDNPVVDAVVYVTDTRTRAVKTYIVGPDGVYRFPALSTNVDYEIYAQSKGKTSDTKRMSQFDDRKVVDILLRIDMR